ncbi:GNAT family N-acetyltransferase, partial [Streptomyces sp. NPDC059627]
MTLQTGLRGGGAPLAPHTFPLDNAVWSALAGPHAHLAERVGRAARYPDDVYAYAALADPTDPAAWADLHTLVGPGATVKIKPVEAAPAGWEVVGGG